MTRAHPRQVRGAWERIPEGARIALHPAMRAALALRILVRSNQEIVDATQPTAVELHQRAEECIASAVAGLAGLQLDRAESGGALGLLDALHVLLSTLPLAAARSPADFAHWIQILVHIPCITKASIAEAELAINQVTVQDRMGVSSALRRALAVAMIGALSHRLDAASANCYRQLSIIAKNLAGVLLAARMRGQRDGQEAHAAALGSDLCLGQGGSDGGGGGRSNPIRNPIHLPTTTVHDPRGGKSVLSAAMVRAMETGGEEEEDQRRMVCQVVCVCAIAQLLLHWASFLPALPHVAAERAGRGVNLEWAFLVTGMRSLLDEVRGVGQSAAWPRACAAKALQQLLGEQDVWHRVPTTLRADWADCLVDALDSEAHDTASSVLLLQACDSEGSMAALMWSPHRMSRAISVILTRMHALAADAAKEGADQGVASKESGAIHVSIPSEGVVNRGQITSQELRWAALSVLVRFMLLVGTMRGVGGGEVLDEQAALELVSDWRGVALPQVLVLVWEATDARLSLKDILTQSYSAPAQSRRAPNARFGGIWNFLSVAVPRAPS
ncbi:MAG: hypothetical protein ACPIOQ_16785 [Promethearchaeia archaeon]